MLGKDGATKSDEFSEKFQTAFDPPSFSENYVAIFFMMERSLCEWVTSFFSVFIPGLQIQSRLLNMFYRRNW